MTVSAGGGILAVAFSGDSTRIVSGSYDKSVRVWDASTGVELKELKGHTGSVFSVAFSSDVQIVSSDDKSASVGCVDDLLSVLSLESDKHQLDYFFSGAKLPYVGATRSWIAFISQYPHHFSFWICYC